MKHTIARFVPSPSAGLTLSEFTALDAFTTADTTELNHFFFANDDESILAGIWECAPCKEIIDAYPVNEMMTMLSGSVTLLNTADKTGDTFVAGDTFFIAKGTPCSGLIEPDTLIRDNYRQLLGCHYERETNQQAISGRV